MAKKKLDIKASDDDFGFDMKEYIAKHEAIIEQKQIRSMAATIFASLQSTYSSKDPTMHLRLLDMSVALAKELIARTAK